MRRTMYLLIVVLTIGLMVITFQEYPLNSLSNTATPSSAAFAPASINYPNPIHQNITEFGVITSVVVSPACSLSSPPCAIANSPLYYITVNGWNYRLIFSNSTKPPLNHTHILVTGVFVTPSTYKASLWLPQMYFRGDIYVTTYSYVFPYF